MCDQLSTMTRNLALRIALDFLNECNGLQDNCLLINCRDRTSTFMKNEQIYYKEGSMQIHTIQLNETCTIQNGINKHEFTGLFLWPR